MQPRIPGFAALTSLLLLAASDLVAAQINAPDCSLTYQWSFNSLDQDACTVAAYLMSTCNGGAFTINALQPGFSYLGPSGTDDADLCKCNTVVYNLLSACDACQGEPEITWSQYSFNCTKILPPSTFPNPIPSGTRVQQWALQDITSVNLWNATTAQTIGDLPEILAGESIGTSSASTASATASAPTSSSTVVSSSNSSSGKSSSNTGAIAGGVAGGAVALAVVAGIVFYFLRRRSPPRAPSAAFVVDSATPAPSMSYMTHSHLHPQSDDGTTAYMPGSPVTPMKLYDPNDPTTYPGYQGLPTSSPDLDAPISSYDGQGSTFSNSQTGGLGGNTLGSRHTSGYHGLPTV